MIQFDPDQDHLFSCDQALAFLFQTMVLVRFHSCNLVRIKLKSPKVQTKWVRCEGKVRLWLGVWCSHLQSCMWTRWCVIHTSLVRPGWKVTCDLLCELLQVTL